jgi:hypothetical protein
VSLPVVVVALVAAAVPAALQARSSSSAPISVTIGVPRELSVKVTPARITSSPAVFKVTNKGKQLHTFKVCTKPAATDKANACAGVATKPLAPGKTASLTVKLATSGSYEYLSGSATQAASGMKGLLTVSLPAATGSTSSGSGSTAGTGTATTPSTTTSHGSTGGTGGTGVTGGAATDPSCPAGTSIPVGPNTGDQDDDNEGGFPSDMDGCL